MKFTTITIALAIGFFSASGAGAASQGGIHQFLEIALSPDGRHVASVEGDGSPFGGAPVIRSLVIRATDGSRSSAVALPCGAVRECWPGALAWSPDGKALVFALRTPKTHERSLYQVSANGDHLTRLLAFDGTIENLRFGPGNTLAMLAVAGARKEVGATQAGAPITGDLAGPVPEQRIGILEAGAIHWSSPPDMWVYQYDWRPDGAGFVGTAAHGDGDKNWWVAKLYAFDAGNGTSSVIFTPPDARHQIADPVVSPDGRTVAFISGIMSDFGSTGGDIYTVPVEGGAASDITPELNASARAIAFDCDGHLRAELLAGPETELVAFTPARTVLWHGIETVMAENRPALAPSCAPPFDALVHETFNAAPEIETGAIGRWHDLTHDNAGLTAPVFARSISWKNDGFDVQGWLLLPPKTDERLPLITVVHGGPAAAATPHFVGPGTNRALLLRGYALFLPNPRGSFGQGEAFAAANVRDLGRGDLSDIMSGIDAVARAARIDEGRLGIMGGSYGGFMTMWAVTQTHRFKAGVAAAGISDWLSYYGENGIDQWMIPYFGTSVYDDPEVYAHASPITYIKNARTPVFEYVGAEDIECPAPQTEEFWHALNDLGVPTSYAIYPDEGHGLRDPAHIADAQARTLAWFDKYLR